jgi:hypothetical protein
MKGALEIPIIIGVVTCFWAPHKQKKIKKDKIYKNKKMLEENKKMYQ